MASRGTVKLLSRGKGRSSWKLLPEAKGWGQQFPRASHLIEGQLIECSASSHVISVLLPNLLNNFYKNHLFVTLKSGELWIRQLFILWPGNSSDCFVIQEIRNKTRETEITNYILYSRLGNNQNSCSSVKFIRAKKQNHGHCNIFHM